MGWCVYILRCGDGSLYAGATSDLSARLARHAAGKGARYTRGRGPLSLVWTRPARGRGAALSLEARLKRLDRAGKLAVVAGAPPPRRPRRKGPGRAPRKGSARR